MTTAETYRTAAQALRSILPRLAEPDQQVACAAALSLDHAAVQAEEAKTRTVSMDARYRPICPTERQIQAEKNGLIWHTFAADGRVCLNVDAILEAGCGYHGPLGYVAARRPAAQDLPSIDGFDPSRTESRTRMAPQKRKKRKHIPKQGHVIKGGLSSAIQRGSNL